MNFSSCANSSKKIRFSFRMKHIKITKAPLKPIAAHKENPLFRAGGKEKRNNECLLRGIRSD